jgi:hypothetical protein
LRYFLILVAGSLAGAVVPAAAAIVPKDTEIAIRLTAKVSSEVTAAQNAAAVVTSPVVVDGAIAIPGGATLSGTVKIAKAATGTDRAQLQLAFDRLTMGSYSIAVSTVISALDNSRETVDANGVIIGIDGSQSYSSRIDEGISKLENNPKLGALAAIVAGAKQTLKIQDVNANIDYDDGVELVLKLTAPLDWRGPATGPEAKLTAFTDETALGALAARQPFRTSAEKPPKLSDLTNLMFVGSEADIRAAFTKAGWSPAAALSGASKLETARALIENRGYREGPMSVLLLDGRPPEMTWQKGNNTFAARHHLRVFRRPDTWQGLPVWVSSSTHDTGIEFSERDRTFIHKIDSNIDNDRAKVVNDLLLTGMVKSLALADRPVVPMDATNATGDALKTDGRIAILLIGQ